jgi:hypothetical protein
MSGDQNTLLDLALEQSLPYCNFVEVKNLLF